MSATTLNLVLPANTDLPPDALTSINTSMRLIQTALTTLAQPTSTTSAILQGNHAARVATDATKQPQGAMFWESDRFSLYVVKAIGKTGSWAWAAGFDANTYNNLPNDLGLSDNGFVFYATDQETLYVFNGTTSTWASFSSTIASGPLSGLPTGLGTKGAGTLYHVTTGSGGVAYNHTFQWTGTAWAPAERERLGGYFADYAKTPTEPGWQACDGSATHYLDVVSGALVEVAFTVPNLSAGVYRKSGGAYTGNPVNAGTITLAGETGATSAGTPTGTVTLAGDTGEASAGTPAGTVTTEATETTPVVVLEGSAGSVSLPGPLHTHPATFAGTAMPNHDHDLSAATAALTGSPMPTHQHDLSDATATFLGDPVNNLAVLTYFRR